MAGTCYKCGVKFTYFGNASSAGNGLCLKCDGDRHQRAVLSTTKPWVEDDPIVLAEKAVETAIAGILVTTETLMPDIEIVHRYGVVGADVAFGAGPLKDISVALSNAFGGRSETMRNLIGETRSVALQELKREAHALGANAVIGVAFTVSSIGQGGTMTLVCATGTAATVKMKV